MYIPDATRRAFDMVETAARAAWAVREPETVSGWAEKYRYLPQKVSETPGLIDLDRTPYLRWIMDLANNPDVRKVVVKKCSQVGLSTAMDTILLWSVDQDPAQTLWYCPNFDLARTACKQRIEPAAMESPVTAAKLGTAKEDRTAKMLEFDQMRVFFLGAGSTRQGISRPGKRVFVDDFDDCPPFISALAEQRVSTFPEHLLFFTGVPTYEGVGIDVEFERGQKWYFAVPCPHPRCGHYHELVWENLRWEGGLEADPAEVRKHGWMECPACKGKIENHHKPGILRRGKWMCEDPRFDGRIGEHVSVRITPFVSPFQNFGFSAKGFLDAAGKPPREWWNGMQGRAVRSPGSLNIDQVRDLAAGGGIGAVAEPQRWARRLVPDEAAVLIATVDVQAEYAYVLVSAMDDHGLNGYYVDHFSRPVPPGASLEPLYHEVRERAYRRLDGRWMRILMQAWDTGHRPIDVYAVWKKFQASAAHRRKHPFVLVKGHGSLNMTKPWTWSAGESEATKARAMGVKVLILNTKQWKDQSARALKAALVTVQRAAQPQPEGMEETEESDLSLLEATGMASDVGAGGADGGVGVAMAGTAVSGAGVLQGYFLPRDTPKDFMEHLCSEHVVHGRWEEIREHVRNEGWDCLYYLGAVADAGGMRMITKRMLATSIVAAPSASQAKAWGVRVEGSGMARAAQRETNEQAKPRRARPAKQSASLASMREKLAARMRAMR